MKALIAPVLIVSLLAAPVRAQEEEGDVDRGVTLLEQGAELLLRGLIEEMRPKLDEMQKGLEEAAREMGPKLGQFLALIDDIRNYEAPERLPNGDIVLRRKPGAPPPPPLLSEPPVPGPDGGPEPSPERQGPQESPENGIEL